MNNGTFDFNTFIKESKDTLLNPKSYFTSLKITGGLIDPLIKAVIYGLIAGVFAFLWNILNLSSMTGGMLGNSVGVFIIAKYAFISVVGLFIGAVITLIISSICKGNTDFEANVRVIAAILVILPISAALDFTGGINFYFGIVVSLAINIFAFWLLYNGLIETLKTKPETTKTVVYVLIGIFVITMLLGVQKMSEANRIMNQFKNIDFKELPKN
jgi:Yip1 domain